MSAVKLQNDQRSPIPAGLKRPIVCPVTTLRWQPRRRRGRSREQAEEHGAGYTRDERAARSQGRRIPRRHACAVVAAGLACKTVPCDWPLGRSPLCRLMVTDQQLRWLRAYITRSGKRRQECASANGFANETGRDGGDDTGHRRRSLRPSPDQRDAPLTGDGGDVRRSAHNPATIISRR